MFGARHRRLRHRRPPCRGPIGDHVWRRPLLLVSVALVGISSLFAAVSGSIAALSLWRFFTGVGLGGAFPSAATLGGDYAPQRLRATSIMASFTDAPLGGFVGGLIVAVLLGGGFGWPVIFVLGGVFPLALLPILALWLPESLRFLAAKSNLSLRQAALLERLAIAPGQSDPQVFDLAHGNPVKMRSAGVCVSDRAVVDYLLLQPDEPVLIRLLAVRGVALGRAVPGAGGLRYPPIPVGRYALHSIPAY